MYYRLYPKAVKSLNVTLSGSSVSYNDVNGKDGDKTKGIVIPVNAVTVTMADGTSTSFVNTKSESTDKLISDYFNIEYRDNTSITNKAKVVLTFQDKWGSTYPTGIEYVAPFSITKN